MLLSRDKINCLSKAIMQGLDNDDLVDFVKEDNDVRLQIVKLVTAEMTLDDEVDQKVRKILKSYSRKIIDGTNEWDIMYRKLFEEEMSKKRNF